MVFRSKNRVTLFLTLGSWFAKSFSQVWARSWVGPGNSDPDILYMYRNSLYTVLVHMLIEKPATTTLRLTNEASNVKHGSSPLPFLLVKGTDSEDFKMFNRDVIFRAVRHLFEGIAIRQEEAREKNLSPPEFKVHQYIWPNFMSVLWIRM
jgi:hypothetical protein